jgi:hypothetical protein
MQKIRLLCLLIIANMAFADGGYYVGIGAGYSNITANAVSPLEFTNPTTNAQDAQSFTSQLYFGYDLYKWLGLQLDYNVSWLGQYNNSYSVTQQTLGPSVLFHLPFSLFSDSLSGASVYTKLGYDYNAVNFDNVGSCSACSSLNSSATGFSPLFGLGAELGFKHIGYRLEWDYLGGVMAKNNTGNNAINTSSSSFLASIMYHF